MKRSPASFLNLLLTIFWVFVISIPHEVKAQENAPDINGNLQSLVLHTDSLLGADDELVNGKIYIQKNLLAEGHPFFLTNAWQPASIIINGKLHDGLFLKYDIHADEIVLKAERKRGGASVISLNNEFIESFYLKDRYFTNSMAFDVKGIETDFVEPLYQGSFIFFVSYKKSYNNDYNTKTPYGSYGKTTTSYFILEDHQLSYISSKKAMLKYFDPYKKSIKKFMKKSKIKYSKASFGQLHNLMQYCDELTKGK
ncbi:MAG: hypothetical protein V2I62_00280 [Bacteroidales bacterium]|nr:hypothetical protein [Bacteroidales bacterium]